MYPVKIKDLPFFVGNLLTPESFGTLDDNADMASYIRSIYERSDLPVLTVASPAGDEFLARFLAEETMWHLQRDHANHSFDWYSRSIRNMISIISLIHPELTDDGIAVEKSNGVFKSSAEARTVFFSAIAITSQNNKVGENLRYALEQYRLFLTKGAFEPKVYGSKGGAIANNLHRFNLLFLASGNNLHRVGRFLSMQIRMGDMVKVAKKNGFNLHPSELLDEKVNGSIIFGPKIGSFYQNILGNHSPVTMDLWFMRTWGRITGTLLKGELVPGSLDRFCDGMKKAGRTKYLREMLEKEGLYKTPNDIRSLSIVELFNYTKSLRLFWERCRRSYVKGRLRNDFSQRKRLLPQSNEQASDLKSRLIWPLAVESIVQAVGYTVDAPTGRQQRRWIRSVVARSLDILKNNGVNISAADMQATLWYPEKEIYGHLTGRNFERMNISFEDAARDIAIKEGVSLDQITEVTRNNDDRRCVAGNMAKVA